VRLTFYDQQGKKPGTLTSKTGDYDVRTGVMVARGNVVLVTYNDKGEKRTIRSEELHYDQRGDRVWSERETFVEEAAQTFVSQGFTSDTRFTNIQGRNAKSTGVQVNQAGGGL
jgi:LPS export ABC transporter protein LptC